MLVLTEMISCVILYLGGSLMRIKFYFGRRLMYIRPLHNREVELVRGANGQSAFNVIVCSVLSDSDLKWDRVVLDGKED